MSVINKMNRDLERRQAASDTSLAPVLTSVPWWHSNTLYKGVFVLVFVGLTLVSGYLLWFAKPAPLDNVALTAEPSVLVESQPLPTTNAQDKVIESQTELNQIEPNQTSNAQSQAMLAAVSSSDDNRIKVLDAEVVFITDIAESESEMVADASVNEADDEAMTEAMTEADTDVIAESMDTADAKATTEADYETVSQPLQQVEILPSVAVTASPNASPTVAPTVAPTVTPTLEPPLTLTAGQHSASKASPAPIAIVDVAQANHTSQQSETAGEDLVRSEQSHEPVKVKPTPAGPSSLTIKPSELTDSELIALYQKKARTAKSKGDLASAQSLLQNALTIDPRHVEVRKELAALHYGRGEYSQAMTLLEQGVALVPSNADFRLMQARIYLAGQQQVQALQVLDAITPAVASNQDFYATKAALAQQLNQDNKALEAYLALARTQPKQGKWWLGLAISQEKLGQTEQALRSYQQAELVGGLSLASMDYVKGRIVVLQ